MDSKLKQCLIDFTKSSPVERMAMRLALDDQLAAPGLKRDECSRLLRASRLLSELDDKINDHADYRLRRPN
jgi:hypothetical protein